MSLVLIVEDNPKNLKLVFSPTMSLVDV